MAQLPEFQKGRSEKETNLQNKTTPEYEAGWKKFLKEFKPTKEEPDPWKAYQKIAGTKHDENNQKLKPAYTTDKKTKVRTYRSKLGAQGAPRVELRAHRENLLNFIFGDGKFSDITTIGAVTDRELKRSGYAHTTHHMRLLSEDGTWTDPIIKLLLKPKGSADYKKGEQMAHTARNVMESRGLRGKAGTALGNLSSLRTQNPETGGRNWADSPHLITHNRLDEANITAGKASPLEPTARMDHPEDADLPKGKRRRISTTRGLKVGDENTPRMGTQAVIQQLPSDDTDAFIYTQKKDKFDPKYRLNQEVKYTGRQLNPKPNYYSAWADQIETSYGTRVGIEQGVRQEFAETADRDLGRAHYQEAELVKQNPALIDTRRATQPQNYLDRIKNNLMDRGWQREAARLAGQSAVPWQNIAGDFVGVVFDGIALAANPRDTQNIIDFASSSFQLGASAIGSALIAIPDPLTGGAGYLLMRAGDRVAMLEKLYNMQREGIGIATGKIDPRKERVDQITNIADQQAKELNWNEPGTVGSRTTGKPDQAFENVRAQVEADPTSLDRSGFSPRQRIEDLGKSFSKLKQ